MESSRHLGVIFKNLSDGKVTVDEDGEESYEKDSGESDMGGNSGSGGSSDEPLSDEGFPRLIRFNRKW